MLKNFIKQYIIGTSRVKHGKNPTEISKEQVPRHVAIIMDGNGRWARSRGLPRTAGHRAGVESLKSVVEACGNIGVQVLTVYAFSTENWKRPQEEVNVLMNLLSEYIGKELETLYSKGIKINTIGQIEYLPTKARESLRNAKEATRNNTKLILNLALNYGGRAELLKVIKEIAMQVSSNKLNINDIDEALVGQFLDTSSLPDPDLLIRPSGELRISNFLLWQLAYTEFWYTDVLWPDFRQEHLFQAIADYQKRDRRFGGIKL